MKVISVLFAVLLLLFTAPLCAQITLGVEGGFGYNIYYTNISNRPATNLMGAAGYTAGLTIRYRLNPWLCAIATPGLVQKGYTMNRTDSLTGEYDLHRNNYLQLPIGISLYRKLGRFCFELDPGIYVAYWLSGRIEGRTANIFSASQNGASGQSPEVFQLTGYSESWSFQPGQDNRWEAGWWIGPGVQYQLSGPFLVSFNARYYQSLTSQQKSQLGSIPAYNRTWTFSIGGLWSLSKDKHTR